MAMAPFTCKLEETSMRAMAIMYHDVVENGDFDSSGFPGEGANVYKLRREDFECHLEAISAAVPPATVTTISPPQHAVTPEVFLTFDDGGVSSANPIADLLELRDRLDAALQQPVAPPQRSWLDRWRQPPRAQPEPWREGIGIMARRLDRILSDRRVSRLELIGRLFDPRTARAVGTRQDERFGPGIIVEEVRAGYLWDDDLLRTAEVIVSKTDEGDNQS